MPRVRGSKRKSICDPFLFFFFFPNVANKLVRIAALHGNFQGTDQEVPSIGILGSIYIINSHYTSDY